MNNLIFDAELEIITPVIINNGEKYDFCEFIPYGNFCFKSGMQDLLLKNLSAQDARIFAQNCYSAIVKNNNEELIRIRNSLLNRKEMHSYQEGRVLPYAWGDLKTRPMQRIDKIHTSLDSGFPYIPGSSIKGAIRTAILEALRENSSQSYSGKSKEIESKILKYHKINEDPLKGLKVSDFMLPEEDGMIYIGKINTKREIPIYTAMTNSYAFSGRKIKAEGTISISEDFLRERFKSYEEFLSKVSCFYKNNFDQANFKKALNKSDLMKKTITYLKDNFYTNVYLIRLGHYIGIQNYTLKVYNEQKKSEIININGGVLPTIDQQLIVPGICFLRVRGKK